MATTSPLRIRTNQRSSRTPGKYSKAGMPSNIPISKATGPRPKNISSATSSPCSRAKSAPTSRRASGLSSSPARSAPAPTSNKRISSPPRASSTTPSLSPPWPRRSACPIRRITSTGDGDFLLSNHTHDANGGCAPDAVCEEIAGRYAKATDIGDIVTEDAMCHIARNLSPKGQKRAPCS